MQYRLVRVPCVSVILRPVNVAKPSERQPELRTGCCLSAPARLCATKSAIKPGTVSSSGRRGAADRQASCVASKLVQQPRAEREIGQRHRGRISGELCRDRLNLSGRQAAAYTHERWQSAKRLRFPFPWLPCEACAPASCDEAAIALAFGNRAVTGGGSGAGSLVCAAASLSEYQWGGSGKLSRP